MGSKYSFVIYVFYYDVFVVIIVGQLKTIFNKIEDNSLLLFGPWV